MLCRLPAFFLAVCFASAADTHLVRETEALSAERERAALRVPDGFEVQLFASEPMVNKPINMAFDASGRLWVSSTVEYPYSADKRRWADAQGSRVEESRDAIKILEDTDGDGRADRAINFADGLNIPTGVLPWHKPEHKAGCIAWSIPNIWYFGDSDGDDKADVREVLFGPLGYEKDTHGMCSSFRLGWDGWVYATHGFNNTSRLRAEDGSTLELHSGNVFRFRPDASRVEIWSWGQVNPFGLCFDHHHNLYSADCHSAPIYQLLRGAHYPSFGKPHDGLGFAPVMCEHTHGSTGICGIVYIDSGVWGPEWDDHILIGNVVTSRVNADRVTFTGATPKANEKPDFLVSDDPWFRPVDLQLGPDNALYIADFYNKIIGHYEVPLEHPGRDKERGRIWRVAKRNAVANRREVRRPEVGETQQEWVAALAAPSAFVRLAAVAALQEQPALSSLHPLIAFAERVPKDDPQLAHATKLALRAHLALPGAFASLPANAESLATEIAVAVPTPEAADFLLHHLSADSPSLTALNHIAKFGAPSVFSEAIAWAR
ncbi:MAG TPA: PVC-type heme-binding CxxCH protein, partial [Prosthecobacter sp.]|nr:PVC-type heme-binding CxxCH protein [Prosthecobacter sp.]